MDMDSYPPAIVDLTPMPAALSNGVHKPGRGSENGFHPRPVRPPDAEALRRVAWVIGEQRDTEQHQPANNHVGLGFVNHHQGFAHWRIRQQWIDEKRAEKGDAWRDCALVLRLYDVSHIVFDGFNAHRLQDFALPSICGHMFLNLGRPGSWQLGEVGFRLRTGEFLPAARSGALQFPTNSAAAYPSHEAILVDEYGQVEPIANLWDQDKILQERRKPRLRGPLRIAAFSFETLHTGNQGLVATFASELAGGQRALGHEVHLFVPASPQLQEDRVQGDVWLHPVSFSCEGDAVTQAHSFAAAAEERLRNLPDFHLFHFHEWMTASAPWASKRPSLLSITSTEPARCNGRPPAREIVEAERAAAKAARYIITPPWLRDRAVNDLAVDTRRIHAFPMEAKLPNEWEAPIDFGEVKKNIGFGPLDRLLLFIGPLEWGAGPDLMVEALPTVMRRAPSLRLAFAGTGGMHGHLQHRANELGIGGCVRVLGHVERPFVISLLRAAEALVLPSRHRVPFDDAVVDMARLAGRPVVTTHSGPGYLVRHEDTGIVTYDNPGSIVWALDRIAGDPGNAERMGRNGKRNDGASAISWNEVVRHYEDLAAIYFPELRASR